MIYYYPNRPILISPDNPSVELKSNDINWDAEIKWNGDRLVLQKQENPNKKNFENFVFFNRENDVLKYAPIKELMEELKALNLPPETQLDGELLHNKTKKIKNRIIFYDIYILGGHNVTGILQERRDILKLLFNDKKFKHIEIAERFETGFTEKFKEVITREECEGLVLKNKTGKIVFNTIKSPDVCWQNKIRREHKNYKF